MDPRQRKIMRKASAAHQRRRPPPASAATNFGNSYENFILQRRRREAQELEAAEAQLRKQNIAKKLKAQKVDQFVKKLRENHAATKIQARVRGILNRKKVAQKKVRLLREREKQLLNQLAKFSPNSPRTSPNASPRIFSPNASPSNNKEIAALYKRSRRPTKILITESNSANKSPTLAELQREIMKKRKRKSSPKKQPSKRRRVDLNLPKPNAATARKARRRVIEKRQGQIKKRKKPTTIMKLTDLITGKEKIYTKEGWFLRAKAKQNALRARICA